MNKPAHLQENLADDTIRENRVNRNLSPSFARIQALGNKPPPVNIKTSVSEEESRPRTDKTKLAPAPLKTHHAAADNNAASEQQPFLARPSASEAGLPPPTNPVRLTPWIIASITLTLALFSGNYAWDTQQKVDKLSQRLELLEAQTATPPATNLLKDNDNFAKTEQELLTFKKAQEQLNATISTLQNELTADTEQASSRLTSLEDSLADLISQAPATTLDKPDNKPLAAQTIDNKSSSEAVVAMASDEASNSPGVNEDADAPVTDNWLINIASFSDPRAANKSYAEVLKIVSKASIKPTTIKDKTVYRVRAESYSSQAEAERAALALQTQLGLSGLWVSRD